jgi:hypothetical protein
MFINASGSFLIGVPGNASRNVGISWPPFLGVTLTLLIRDTNTTETNAL